MSETTIRTGSQVSRERSQVSREQVEIILKKFLDNNNGNYRVLALKGAWGVGKTHLVQNILAKHEKESHYYASVFGISSIEQLKSRILANYKNDLKTNVQYSQITTNINSVNKFIAITVDWLNRNYEKIKATPKVDVALAGIPSIPVVGSLISVAGDLGLNLLFNGVKNSIICIDDLERKSNLQLDEMLGFVEYLVREMKCRVILIYNYNEETLDSISKNALKQYREKVIDIEVELKPTVEENLNIEFKDHPDIEVIKSVFKKAETNNIRVLRKTKWFIDELIPFMSNWEPSLREQIIKNTIVIALAKLDSEFYKRFSIDIETIITPIISPRDLSKNLANGDEISKKQEQNRTTLSKLGFYKLELDEQIIKLVETSLFNDEEFKEKGKTLNEKEKATQILISKFHSLLKSCFSSFKSSEHEKSQEVIQFLEEHHLDLSINDFKTIEEIALALELDISSYKKSLLASMIKNTEDILNLISLRKKVHNFPDLTDALETKIAEYNDINLDITKALQKIIKGNSKSQEDKGIFSADYYTVDYYSKWLNNVTVDDYAEWLSSLENLYDHAWMIDFCLKKMGGIAPKNLRTALIRFAKESKFNAHISYYLFEINIEDDSDTEDTKDAN